MVDVCCVAPPNYITNCPNKIITKLNYNEYPTLVDRFNTSIVEKEDDIV